MKKKKTTEVSEKLTVAQVAEALSKKHKKKVTRSQVYYWILSGKIKELGYDHDKFGGIILLTRASKPSKKKAVG